jgi:predicted small integral membrane protein
MCTRFSKIALIWGVAFYTSLVVLNNIVDYGSNYTYVFHILKMDTTFPDNAGMWRAIETPFFYHAAYVLIIIIEMVVAVLCWGAGVRLLKAAHDAKNFNEAKGMAILGLTLGIFLWFVGFIAIGGEWFLMWQSEIWNGQDAAFRLTVIFGMVLLYLVMPDSEKDA